MTPAYQGAWFREPWLMLKLTPVLGLSALHGILCCAGCLRRAPTHRPACSASLRRQPPPPYSSSPSLSSPSRSNPDVQAADVRLRRNQGLRAVDFPRTSSESEASSGRVHPSGCPAGTWQTDHGLAHFHNERSWPPKGDCDDQSALRRPERPINGLSADLGYGNKGQEVIELAALHLWPPLITLCRF